jgi:hypothetical protein
VSWHFGASWNPFGIKILTVNLFIDEFWTRMLVDVMNTGAGLFAACAVIAGIIAGGEAGTVCGGISAARWARLGLYLVD